MQSDSHINDEIVKVIQQQHLEIDPNMLTDSIDASTTALEFGRWPAQK